MARLIRGVAGILGFLLLWEGFSRSGAVRPEFLPPASTVLARLVALGTEGPFVADVVATTLAWAIALGLTVLVAVPAGLLLGSVAGIRAATRALVELLRPIPSVALIPLVVIVLGTGPETKIALAVYAGVWPLLFTTVYAMSEVEPLHLDTARSFGLSRRRTLATVALPHAAPSVMTGVRLSAAVTLVVVVSTELLAGGSGGLGTFVFEAGSGGGGMDRVLAGTVVAGLLGLAVNVALEQVQRRWLGWDAVGDAR